MLRRLNILNWPIRIKLISTFLVAILIPIFVLAVPAVNDRVNALRDENRTRLETLGPYEIARVEQLTQVLRNDSTAILSQQTVYTQIEQYLYKSQTVMSDAERDRNNRLVQNQIIRLLEESSMLSRLRVFGSEGNLLIDAVQQGDTISLEYDQLNGPSTPADPVIYNEQVEEATAITAVYRGADGSPSMDVIFSFSPNQVTSSGERLFLGYVVLTYNVTISAEGTSLPDLYTVLSDFPQGKHETYVFLLDEQGQLISPGPENELWIPSEASPGFQTARQGDTGVTTYHSPLLDTEVMGYTARITMAGESPMYFLVETPIEEIDEQAFEDVLATFVPLVAGALGFGLLLTAFGSWMIARPIVRLARTARQVTIGSTDVPLTMMARRDEIGILNNSLLDMATQLLTSINELETRVEDRTHNLETTLEIGQILTSIRDLDLLLEEVVNLILSRFDKIYHAQVFLIDERTNLARLRASTGVAGRQLLQRAHALEVGSQSVIGSVTASGHAVVALDTSSNPLHKRNEFLPDTRAEMALPLRIENRIIGALDLQSKLPDAFDEQDVDLFQGMADQITIAIESAMLFQESTNRLQEIENLNRMLTHAAWEETTRERGQNRLVASSGQTQDDTGWSALQRKAVETRQITHHVEGSMVTFAVPVLLRGEVLGAVEWQVPETRYTQNVRQTALELTTRLALTADNIRLFQQGQRVALRELRVNEISGKLLGTTDIDQILQTAVRELGLALRTPQAAIQLVLPSDNGTSDE